MSGLEQEARRNIYDKLEHGLTLSNLVNLESLGNLLERFAEFLGIGMGATEADGRPLGRSRGRPQQLCMLGDVSRASQCPVCGVASPAPEGEEKFLVAECLSRVRYVRARVDNQFEPVGQLILGPYRLEAEEASAAGPGAPAALDGVPVMSQERAGEAALLMCAVLEELVFANFQSYLFSKMHLQLSRENVGEVTGQGGDAPGLDEPLLDSGEYGSLF